MKRSAGKHRFFRPWGTTSVGGLILAVFCTGAIFVGCTANDPFDPSTAPNEAPVARLFAAPVDPEAELTATSYNERTFFWSGNDKDGWITEFHVSIRTDRNVPSPWAVTQDTDTTMTFETDEFGQAEATIYLVCKDNMGALSDTLKQLIPLTNFPPVINFESDFDHRHNLQRDLVGEDEYTYWNWGVNNFRLFAFDPDGSSTMDKFFRYTLASDVSETVPEITRDYDDPLADAETEWIRVPFSDPDEQVHHFEIFLTEVEPGDPRTLTVSVVDEANADTHFEYEWVVKAPKGQPGSRVLFVKEGGGVPTVFSEALDLTYGDDGWDVYRFWTQFPDKPSMLVETFCKFDLVIWGNSGGASTFLKQATSKDTPVLDAYVNGLGGAEPGKLFVFSPTITGGSSTLSPSFHANVLKVQSTSTLTKSVTIPEGKQVRGVPLPTDLLPMTSQSVYPELKAIILDPLVGQSEINFKMEFCAGCYGGGRTGPPDPDIGARWPVRRSGPARVVVLGFTPENFYDPSDVTDTNPTVLALQAILEHELEVVPQ
ncbi:MAG: hypothetical protein KOO60_13360 [Gemmatimonadales bacterium]|nr:hypothetical protein [Gemmatimonadales bacterium]